jgi:hypothetical protein
MTEQNYKNHRRFVPLYHFVLSVIVLACIIGSIWIFYQAFFRYNSGRLIALVLGGLSVSCLFLMGFVRTFALKAQDRAIRAEENLRYFVLTGKLLDSRLTIQQIIALRFANDEEFITLANKAVAKNLKAEDIKKAIVQWRGDHYRA